MAVNDQASKYISHIDDWDIKSRTLSDWRGIDATRQRQPRTAKTNEQLIQELVQTSRLLAKPTDPTCSSLDLNDSHGNEFPWALDRSYGQSTTVDRYQWPQTGQIVPTGPLPEKAEVLLYPDRNRKWYESTTQATYRGQQVKRPELAKPFDGSLKPEGEMQMDTTTRMAYKGHDFTDVTNSIHSKGGRHRKIGSTMPLHGKFYGETQAMRDFPGFGEGQPPPPEPIPPAPDNLGVAYHVQRSFETEQRRQFTGIDPVQHRQLKPIKKLNDSIQISEEPFEKMTNHKLDYLPVTHPPPVRKPLPPLGHSITAPDKSRAFDGQTTNQLSFKEWPLSPRHRYGDFHDAYSFVPPINGASMGARSEPQEEAASDTTHRWQFTTPSLVHGLTKVQETVLLKELRRRKMEKNASVKEIGSRNH